MAIDTGVPRRFVTTTVEVEGREETKVVELPEHDPTPWGEDARALTSWGSAQFASTPPDKVTGRARYTADIVRVGMLHAAILRSRVAAWPSDARSRARARASRVS